MSKTGAEYLESPEKRAFDRLICRAGLRPLAAFCVKLASRYEDSPVFTQQRSGANGEPFTIYKLRTLNAGRLAFSEASLLRSLGFDESLQYRNVIEGQMIVLGTRRAMIPDEEQAIVERADPYLAEQWINTVYPLPPSIISTDTLVTHQQGAADYTSPERCNLKLRRDIRDVTSASLQRDIAFTAYKYSAALLRRELHDPKDYS